MDITDKIIAYECGDIDEAGILELFAELITKPIQHDKTRTNRTHKQRTK